MIAFEFSCLICRNNLNAKCAVSNLEHTTTTNNNNVLDLPEQQAGALMEASFLHKANQANLKGAKVVVS